MILVDKNIKAMADKGELICLNFNPDQLDPISYDFVIDKVILSEEEHPFKETTSYDLRPNEIVYIRTKEKIKIPNNIVGRIYEKNSIMRTGLSVSGPHYQPGTETFAFLRVHNISSGTIRIKEGLRIAQIVFEELTETPFNTYNHVYQNEISFQGYIPYADQYNMYLEKMKKVNEKLEDNETKIYANILTFMGIFVSIFSLIIFNFGVLVTRDYGVKELITINASLTLVLATFMAMILVCINTSLNKKFVCFVISIPIVLLITSALLS